MRYTSAKKWKFLTSTIVKKCIQCLRSLRTYNINLRIYIFNIFDFMGGGVYKHFTKKIPTIQLVHVFIQWRFKVGSWVGDISIVGCSNLSVSGRPTTTMSCAREAMARHQKVASFRLHRSSIVTSSSTTRFSTTERFCGRTLFLLWSLTPRPSRHVVTRYFVLTVSSFTSQSYFFFAFAMFCFPSAS